MYSFHFLCFFQILFNFEFSFSFNFVPHLHSKPCDVALFFDLVPDTYVPFSYFEHYGLYPKRLDLLTFLPPQKVIYSPPSFHRECFMVVVDFPFLKDQCSLPVECGVVHAKIIDTSWFGLKVTKICYGIGSFEEFTTVHAVDYGEPLNPYHKGFFLKPMSEVDKKYARQLGYRFNLDSYVVVPHVCSMYCYDDMEMYNSVTLNFTIDFSDNIVTVKYTDVEEVNSCKVYNLIRQFGLLNIHKDLDEFSFPLLMDGSDVKLFGKVYRTALELQKDLFCVNQNYESYLARRHLKSNVTIKGYKVFNFDRYSGKFSDFGSVELVSSVISIRLDSSVVGFFHALTHRIRSLLESLFEFMVKLFISELKNIFEDFIAPLSRFVFTELFDFIYDFIKIMFNMIIESKVIMQNLKLIFDIIIIYTLLFIIRGRHIESLIAVLIYLVLRFY